MSDASNHPVSLFYTRCGAATASAIAIQKNWLQAEFSRGGTVLHSLRDSDSLEVRNSHYHHKQSGMFREGGNIPPIWAKGSGQDTVVVAITWLDEYQGVIVRKDSGIHTVADLKGKRLGVPKHHQAVIDFQRGAAQHGFETSLKLAGLTRDDAIFVDIDAPSYDTQDGPRRAAAPSRRAVELDALDKGFVDAIFLRFARGYRTANDPAYREIININTLADPLLRVNNGTPRPVTVDRLFLDRHPDIVARYLAVLLRTADWAAAHHDEVVRLLSSDNGGATPAEVVASHGPNVHLAFRPQLTDAYIAGLEAQKNFLNEWGYIGHNFSVANDWVVREPLAQALQLVKEQPELTELEEAQAA